jgi:hypothetical protein
MKVEENQMVGLRWVASLEWVGDLFEWVGGGEERTMSRVGAGGTGALLGRVRAFVKAGG